MMTIIGTVLLTVFTQLGVDGLDASSADQPRKQRISQVVYAALESSGVVDIVNQETDQAVANCVDRVWTEHMQRSPEDPLLGFFEPALTDFCVDLMRDRLDDIEP